jgi:hypothetical protein
MILAKVVRGDRIQAGCYLLRIIFPLTLGDDVSSPMWSAKLIDYLVDDLEIVDIPIPPNVRLDRISLSHSSISLSLS